MTNRDLAKERAIKQLMTNWTSLVEDEGMDAEELLESLEEQVERNCQGWDHSGEELENDPYLYVIMGYDEDEMTDEQINEWTEVVCEAAQRYLER